MAIPFKKDRQVTIKKYSLATDDGYGTKTEAVANVVVADHIWANVQDILPSRAESVKNGAKIGVQQTRLRIRNNSNVTALMEVTLHSHGNRVMKIIAGPALLDDRQHMEFVLESYSS